VDAALPLSASQSVVATRSTASGKSKPRTSTSLGENAAATLAKGSRVIVTGRLEQREYTTREGDKRTAIEVVADELGPSLRWATAQVERQSGGGGGGASRGGGNAGGGQAPDPYMGDVEPF
jgi:single-strand DNA-binding protein